MHPARKFSLYAQLDALPVGLTGEILNGQLHTSPRPAGPHGFTESILSVELGGPFGLGRGGPGGWWILVEPEIHFVRDSEVCVPDLTGWRKDRMPEIPQGHRFEVVPDWICEILSPSTESNDRKIKMPIYAGYGVQHAWLVDPLEKTLEAFELRKAEWVEIGQFHGRDVVSIAPFGAITMQLANWWA